MINNYYKLYIEDTYSLAETIVIKFEDAAIAMNNAIMQSYGIDAVDQHDKSSWKYYQNMSGRYHFSDTVMTVTSLDTLEEIVFNRENLLIHTATQRAYQYNTRYYRDLLNRFPQQEMLILGILHNKIDYDTFITKAIEVRDGTILTYPLNYIEENEYNLISNLQTWIYNYVDRWINFQFSLSDDLYPALYMGQLYIHLTPCLLNLRLTNCKTNEAHSFHVRQYLASHGMLDVYLDVMTKEQALFFYRNILYIQRNAGKRDTFDWLIENLMTKRSLPVYEYTMKHDVSKMVPTEYVPDQLSYVPEIFFKRKTINDLIADSTAFTYTLQQVTDKTEINAKSNIEYHEHHYNDIKEQFEDSKSNVVYTKLLESVLDDYTDTVPYPLEQILFNQWIYWSATDRFTAKVNIVFPKTKHAVVMSAKEAFILYLYAFNKSAGIELEYITQALAIRVQRPISPDLTELKQYTESQYVTEAQLQTLLNTVPVIDTMISIDSFYTTGKQIYDATLVQDKLQAQVQSDHTCAQLQLATARFYQDSRINLVDIPTLYSDWLFSFTLDFTDYTDLDYKELAEGIFYTTSGLVDNQHISIKRIQRSMIEMFTLLSSYSIQFISDVNNSGIELASQKEIKLLDIHNREFGYDTVEIPSINVVQSLTKEYATPAVSLYEHKPEAVTSRELSKELLDIDMNYFDAFESPVTAPIEVEDPVFMVMGGSNLYTDWETLTNEQKLTAVSIY